MKMILVKGRSTGLAIADGNATMVEVGFQLAAGPMTIFVNDDQIEEDSREKVAAFIIASGLATGHGDTIDDLLSEAKGQILALKGEIARLTRELEAARIKVRWEGEHLYAGNHRIGWCWPQKDKCLAYLLELPSHRFLGSFPDEPSARAAVEKAAIEALRENGK